jgi:replicative DNA helicase
MRVEEMNMLFKDGVFKLRGKEVSVAGQTLPVVEGYKVGVRGGYVTVDGAAVPGFPDRNIKVMVSGVDSVVESTGSVAAAGQESDAETIERIRTRFNMLNDMTKAVKKGDVRAMIVSGPPGVGKSHGVEEVLERYKTLEQLGARKTHEVIKGAMSPLGLYAALYKMQDAGNVVVFDDCDSIFSDELSLNILKAALDSKKNRKIHWNTDSHKLRAEGIPDCFTFKASAIFITNLKFDKVKGKLREHLEALESRCHYMDLTIDTDREKMLRIRQVIQDGMLNAYKLSEEVKEDIIDFVDANKNRVRELSLRTVLKVADLAVAFPNNWEIYAENTVMRRA